MFLKIQPPAKEKDYHVLEVALEQMKMSDTRIHRLRRKQFASYKEAVHGELTRKGPGRPGLLSLG